MQDLFEKAKHIRLVIFDVDGVLTSGRLFYSQHGTELKDFHAHDGLGMKMLQQSGVQIAIITARESAAVAKRMQDLGIAHVYQGQRDKLSAYEDLKKKLNLVDRQIAYLGDDLPDLPVLRRVGLSATVANAPLVIRDHVLWITEAKGGEGAAREFCELIMRAQETLSSAIESYLQR